MRTFRNATRELDNDTFGSAFWVHKPYKPCLRVQATRISKEEWQKHDARIRELHAEGCTSERARQILRNESHDANSSFNPSAAQYTAHLRELGLRTYNTKRRRGGSQETVSSDDLCHEDIWGDKKVVIADHQQGQNGHRALFKEALRSIPEGRDSSDTPPTSAEHVAVSPSLTPQKEVSGNNEPIADQMSIAPCCVETRASESVPLNGTTPFSLASANPNSLDDTYVLEDGGPLLTFLKVVDSGFAYVPTSTVLKLWPQFTGNSTGVTWALLSEAGEVADILYAARSYADAFDLYYIVFCHLHKTMDTYIRQHLLTAVLNCARASSTDQQVECAMAVLRLTLRDQARGTGDHISAGVLHLYLRELYKKQNSEESEVSTTTAIRYLAEACGGQDQQDPYCTTHRAQTAFELDLPQPLHTSLILQSCSIPPAYARYFTHKFGSPASQLARDIESHTLLKHLLKWCADVVADKARYLNHLASTLTGDTSAMKKCITWLLFCCCFESWLKETKTANGGGRYFSEIESAINNSKMPWRESLSAISSVIVDEAFRGSDPLAAIKKRFTTKTLASHLARTIKAMLGRIIETQQSFTDTFLAIAMASGDDCRPTQVHDLSRKVLEVFTGNLVSSAILREKQGSPSIHTEWRELTPGAADLQEYTVTQSSLSRMLYTPRSSFSSGARSLRARYAELHQISVTSLSSSKGRGLSTAVWSESRRSSWSFELVTGLKPEPSLHIHEEDSSDKCEDFSSSVEDIIMVDVQ